MSGEFDPDLFTEALREDLPNADDEARVRARLATAGVLAGIGVVAPSATAAASGTATAGVLSKMLALPLMLKLGATAVLVGVAAVPVWHARSRATARRAGAVSVSAAIAARTAVPRVATALKPDAPVATAENSPSSSDALATASLATTASTNAASTNATSTNASRGARVRDVTDAAPNVTTAANVASAAPRVRSFAAEAPEDEGTLRAETALMEQALAALKRGDWVVAREKLTEHARAFPDGHLAPERERALERVREKETSR